MKVCYEPIGIIHSEFKEKANVPIQPAFSNSKGYIELKKEYAKGLKDLDGFSHISLIYHFHKSDGFDLNVRPFLDNNQRGVFATRAPKRPNNIGLSIVKLDLIKNNVIYVSNLDILDGSPLLDIKPYVPEFTDNEKIRIGWLRGKIKMDHKSDGRFS